MNLKNLFRSNFLTVFFLAALLLDFNPREAEQASRLSLAAVGDVNLGGKVASSIKRYGADYPWQQVKPVLSPVDLTFGNLECTVSDRGAPVAGKAYTFRGSAESLPAMKEAGFDVVSLANNHSLDFGQIALTDTITALNTAGIGYSGAGENIIAAYQPQVIEIKERKVIFLAFSGVVPSGWEATTSRAGIASAKNLAVVSEKIQAARSQADVVVVSFHWGKEMETYPNAWQKKLGHLAIDSGATLVIGHHPHVVQGIERYKEGVIAYSLGNFVFSPGNGAGRSSIMVRFDLNRSRISEIVVYPVHINGCQPQLLTDSAAQKWLEEIRKRCSAVGTELRIEGDQGRVVCEQEKSSVKLGAFFWRR
jgi:poly-gamma-glutamate synthesis protein (capsule biosynthesis protein)